MSKRALASLSREVSPPPPAKRKIQSTTTKTAITNFFKPASQKPPSPLKWRILESSLLLGIYTPTPAPPPLHSLLKIAAFDFDSTLVSTVSGNRFPKSGADWQWLYPCVPAKLREIHADGFRIVVLTNQNGIKDVTKSADKRGQDFKARVAAVAEAVDVPLLVLAATKKDRFRKPRTGMWAELCEELDADVHGVSLEESYFVGDAAGRAEDVPKKVKKDFSDTDWHLALNVGLRFVTPEEYFLGEEARERVHSFNPEAYIKPMNEVQPIVFKAPTKGIELVIFVGSPGSGKSSFYRRHLKPLGYERVNQDTLKSRDKCVKVAEAALADGKSVAVDNTNADESTRAVWIALAKKLQVPIRAVYFTAPTELCEHNDAARAFGGEIMNPEKRAQLPKVAFTWFKSRFCKPKKEEGLEEVLEVAFQWEGTEEQKEVWRRFWI